MGMFDNLLGRTPVQTPDEALVSGLRELDPRMGRCLESYLLNKTRLTVLSREAGEQYQMVKARTRNEQTREMEPFFREALSLLEQQRKLVAEMTEVAKKRKFRMARGLADCGAVVRGTEETLRRIMAANNDHAINRLQGMNDALAHHKSMEGAQLLPLLK